MSIRSENTTDFNTDLRTPIKGLLDNGEVYSGWHNI